MAAVETDVVTDKAAEELLSAMIGPFDRCCERRLSCVWPATEPCLGLTKLVRPWAEENDERKRSSVVCLQVGFGGANRSGILKALGKTLYICTRQMKQIRH